MSFARTHIKGLVFSDSRMAYRGLTLFTPVHGKGVWLIDMMGKQVNQWQMEYEPGCYGELLPSGNLLYGGKVDDGPFSDMEGAGGILQELDWNGNILWEYQSPFLHHSFHRMKNGNTLVLKWIELPKKIAEKVRGGEAGSEREGVMWEDMIQEIRPSGKVVWEWIAHDHIEPDAFPRCPLCPRDTWLHTNACIELPDGNILVSFAKINTVAIIDKQSGDIRWHWGSPGELAHQHSPTMLENGNILVYDNGYHSRGLALSYSRVVEVDPWKNEMVWSYEGPEGGELKMLFYSSMYSSCQRLPNGNTLICEGTTGRIFEITMNHALVWEYVNYLPSCEPSPIHSRSYPVYSAYRYGINYPGLAGLKW
jgi:hypothetical protein